MAGPLTGMKVVELQGRGPGPFGAMILADLGAEVVRVSRLDDVDPSDEETDSERMVRGHRRIDLLTRGRRSVAVARRVPSITSRPWAPGPIPAYS